MYERISGITSRRFELLRTFLIIKMIFLIMREVKDTSDVRTAFDYSNRNASNC